MTNPPWADEKACLEFVRAELQELAEDEEREFHLLAWDTFPSIPAAELVQRIEQRAVDKAKKGQTKDLASLVDPTNPFNRNTLGGKLIRDRLSPATWRLVTEHLEGKKHGKQSRPPMTDEERRAKNPIHDAADLVDTIESVFRRFYEDVRASKRKARAIDFAANIAGVERDKLHHHTRRGKTDRRRVRRKK